MDDKNSIEWWRWRLYRGIADYLHAPTPERHAAVTAVMAEYKDHRQSSPVPSAGDEHEWVMDWR